MSFAQWSVSDITAANSPRRPSTSSPIMSGHPQEPHYEDGYGHPPQGTDSYYHDDHDQAYYDQHQDYQQPPHGGDGYYDES